MESHRYKPTRRMSVTDSALSLYLSFRRRASRLLIPTQFLVCIGRVGITAAGVSHHGRGQGNRAPGT